MLVRKKKLCEAMTQKVANALPDRVCDPARFALKSSSKASSVSQTKPPTYDFTNIKVPLAMYFVKNDVFTGMDTTKRLISELKLKRQDYKIIDGHSLSHQDVLWASDARCWIYDSVIARLDNIEKGRGPARSNYFTNTVPRYLDSLQLEHNCE